MHREAFPRADVGLTQTFIHVHRADTVMLRDDVCSIECALQVAGCNEVEAAEFRRCCTSLCDAVVTQVDVGATLPALFDVPQTLTVAHDEEASANRCGLHPNAG